MGRYLTHDLISQVTVAAAEISNENIATRGKKAGSRL
jgi:hypothetical protein